MLEGKVRAPAIALLVSNIVGMALGAVGFLVPEPTSITKQYSDYLGGEGISNAQQEHMVELVESMMEVSYTLSFIPLLIGIFLIWGCLQMMNGKNYGVAMAVCILSMIPCTGPCCLLGIPFGIWGLVALSDGHIKQMFREGAR